jgi:hypothetical protein
LEEGLARVGSSGQVERQVAYSRDLGRLLRRERRGEEAEGEGDGERSAYDHHAATARVLAQHRGDLPPVVDPTQLDLPARREAEGEDQHRVATCYSITWSACSSSDCGIVRPKAFAVFRLMTNSNFVGCSMGRSAGLAPFRILST